MPLHPVLVSILCLIGLANLTGAATAGRPNVLLIAVDDLKPLLGAYGDALARTPNIDRLAASGTVLESAYCNQAVCAPSRNALMTGLRPGTIGIYDLATHFRVGVPDAITVAQHFKAQGYRTEGLGKIYHVGHGNTDDVHSWSVDSFRAKGPGNYVSAESNKLPRGPAVENADVPDNAYADGRVADEAVARIVAAGARPDQPFFIAVGFVKPHLPFCAPKKYWDMFDRSKFVLPTVTTAPEGAPSYAPTNWGELRNYGGIPASGPIPPDQHRELIHGYYAATAYMDAQVGRILEALDRAKASSNTIVVLWGDHGWHLGDHGMWAKHTNYEQASRIPVIIRAPGVTSPGTRTRALFETVDLYPTLVALAGLPSPATKPALDGRSFVATLRDPKAASKEAIFHFYPRSQRLGRAVRTDRYRLVEWKQVGAAPATADLELYDYQADPLETKNLAASQPEVVARLRALLATQPEARAQVSTKGSAKKTTTKKKKQQD
ncbi:MAG TPA: sulfatase [Opitutaceae bacterium]